MMKKILLACVAAGMLLLPLIACTTKEEPTPSPEKEVTEPAEPTAAEKALADKALADKAAADKAAADDVDFGGELITTDNPGTPTPIKPEAVPTPEPVPAEKPTKPAEKPAKPATPADQGNSGKTPEEKAAEDMMQEAMDSWGSDQALTPEEKAEFDKNFQSGYEVD